MKINTVRICLLAVWSGCMMNAWPTLAQTVPIRSSFTGSVWRGGEDFTIEFRRNGEYLEYSWGREHPGAWKEISDKKIEVRRRDGLNFTYRLLDNRSLLREWVPAAGQPRLPNVVFLPRDTPAAPSAPLVPASPFTRRFHYIGFANLFATLAGSAIGSLFAALLVMFAYKRVQNQSASYGRAYLTALVASCLIGTLELSMLTEVESLWGFGPVSVPPMAIGSLLMIPIGLGIHSMLVKLILKVPFAKAWTISLIVLLTGLAALAVLLALMYAVCVTHPPHFLVAG
jgi:hypothetical protein